jgi:short-subunit dehydrogenase
MARVAVVTGASSGIGEATVRKLAAEGWDQVLVARRTEHLVDLADRVGGATVVPVDLTDADAPDAVFAAVRDDHAGRLDLLVNNAGVRHAGTFAETGVAGVRDHMALNFDAVVTLTARLLPLLRSTPQSSIVNIASVSSFISRAGAVGYSASKAALRGFSDGLALEEARNGVHVGLVVPGFVETEGFPQTELVANPRTAWAVSTPDSVADAVFAAGPGGQEQVHVPRAWALVTAARAMAPGMVTRITAALRHELTPETRPR